MSVLVWCCWPKIKHTSSGPVYSLNSLLFKFSPVSSFLKGLLLKKQHSLPHITQLQFFQRFSHVFSCKSKNDLNSGLESIASPQCGSSQRTPKKDYCAHNDIHLIENSPFSPSLNLLLNIYASFPEIKTAFKYFFKDPTHCQNCPWPYLLKTASGKCF